MSGGSPTNGVVDNYDDMTPIPIISYNKTNNRLVVKNPVQTTEDVIVDGSITNNILQGQLNSKAPLYQPTFTGFFQLMELFQLIMAI